MTDHAPRASRGLPPPPLGLTDVSDLHPEEEASADEAILGQICGDEATD